MTKKILLILFLLVIVSASSGYSGQYFSEIRRDIENNNLEKALKRCQDILNNPDDERALRAAIFHKFRILKKTRKHEEALNFLNNVQDKYGAQEIPPHFPEILPITLPYYISISVPAWRAKIYKSQEEYTKAKDQLIALKKLLDKYIKASRKEATKHLMYRKLCVQIQLAGYYSDAGNHETAIKELHNATEYGEKFFSLDAKRTDKLSFVPAYMTFVYFQERIGDFYKEMGQNKKALDHYALALENTEKLYVPTCIPEGNITSKPKDVSRLTDKIKQLGDGAKAPNPEGPQCSCASCEQQSGCSCTITMKCAER